MGSTLKLFILLCGLVFVGTVIYLLVQRKINERNSLLWLLGALIILAFSTMPDLLQVLADLTGVEYPPTLLFLFSTLIILFILLFQSIQISVMQERLKELTQLVAIGQAQSVKSDRGEEEHVDK